MELYRVKVKVSVTQSCPTLCDPTDCCLPGSSVHGILQERILEWVPIPLSRGSSWPRNWTWVSCTVSGFFTVWATREAPHQKSWLYLELINFSAEKIKKIQFSVVLVISQGLNSQMRPAAPVWTASSEIIVPVYLLPLAMHENTCFSSSLTLLYLMGITLDFSAVALSSV